MKKGDKILVLTLVIIAALVIGQYAFSSTKKIEKEVIIRSDGEVVKKMILNNTTETEFSIKSKEGFLFVQVKDEKVRVIKSTCPDKLCVKQGWIDKPGESIVCLPNRISITIVGEKNGIDSTTY